MKTQEIIIRADASFEIGSGHVIRCLTLAKELKKNHFEVTWFAFDAPEFLKRDLLSERIPLVELSSEESTIEMVGFFKTKSVAPLLIVDHYRLGSDFEKIFSDLGSKVFVIDDLCNRKHFCDLLLDQNRLTHVHPYISQQLKAETRYLMGPHYALLRREFLSARQEVLLRPRDFKKTLRGMIFLGGSDAQNMTSQVIQALKKIDMQTCSVVKVVVGELSKHKDSIRELVSQDSRFQYLRSPVDLCHLMTESDFCVGAGGTTTWERCAMGLPTAVITIADNQVEMTKAAADEGLCYFLGWHEELNSEKIYSGLRVFLENRLALENMAKRAFQRVDAQGTERVVKELISL